MSDTYIKDFPKIANSGGHCVLLVEDEQDARTSMRILLGNTGYTTLEATDGLEALNTLMGLQAVSRLPELLIMDVRMPRMDGVRLLTEMSSRQIHLPVLAITGYGSKEVLADLLNMGCVGYLDKPFTPDELLEAIAKVLKRAGNMDNGSEGALAMRTGGAAHDLKNLLHIIGGNLELLQPILAGQAEALDMLQSADQATTRATELCHKLMLAARGAIEVRRIVNVNALVRDAMSLVGGWEGVQCLVELPDELWPVSANHTEIVRALQNLLYNARDSMPRGGKLSVRAENMAPDSAAGMLGGAAYVHLSICDTGCGMPPNNHNRLFAAGFSTKPQGSGMGLYVAHEIIRQHGGHMVMHSEQDCGTEANIFLPAAQGAACKAPGRLSINELPRILIMTPRSETSNTLQNILENAGYPVKTAHDATETVYHYEVARRAGRPFAAVIVNDQDGSVEIMRRLRRSDPAVRIVTSVTSGWPEAGKVGMVADGVVTVPFESNSVIETMERVLAG